MIVRIFTKTFTSTQRNSIVGHAADPLGRSLFYSEGVNECSRQIFKLSRMVAGMAAAGLMPDLTPSRYDEEVAQCYQAALRSPKVAKRSTWNGGSDCPSPFY